MKRHVDTTAKISLFFKRGTKIFSKVLKKVVFLWAIATQHYFRFC